MRRDGVVSKSTEKLGLLYGEMDRMRNRVRPAGIPQPVIAKTLAMDADEFRFGRELRPLLGRVRNAIARGAGTVLHLTSATRGEGVSTVARELACAAASMPSCRVLLLDCNLGEDDQGLALGGALPGVVGSYLSHGQIEVAAIAVNGATFHAAAFDGTSIDFIACQADDVPPAATEAGGTRNAARTTAELYRVLTAAYNLIVVDCPPVAEAPYFLPLSQETPDVLLVVQAEETRIPVVMRARDEIPALGGRLVGVVMNRRRRYIPKFLQRRL